MPSKASTGRWRRHRFVRGSGPSAIALGSLATALLAFLALPGAAGGPGGAARPATRDGCTNVSVLASWSPRALANETIVFPVEEGAVLAAAPAAGAGYGGIILFGSSAPNALAAQLAALRRDVPHRLGLLVMTDEEGGGIQRMANLVGSMPWASQMAASMTPPQIEALTRAVALRMAHDGVNVDLAPSSTSTAAPSSRGIGTPTASAPSAAARRSWRPTVWPTWRGCVPAA